MRIITEFTVLLLVGLAAAAPTSNEEDKDDETVVITKSFFPKDLVKYTSQHDIVQLLLPINSLNFDEDDSSESNSKSNEEESPGYLFFVEADVDADGKRDYKGLYVLKEDKATKLLENGRDAAASGDESKQVFLAATDGLYVYNVTTNTADKYGPITDSIIGIAKEKTGDVIYILTEDHSVYKVTNNGETKEKLDDVVNAQQIVVDLSNNLFFSTDDKKVYVRTADGVKKIDGLPENPSYVNLIKPPFIIDEGLPVIVNTVTYLAYPNGTNEHAGFEFKPKAIPTAFAPEAALIQYYAYDKKIYEYNILVMVLGTILEELKSYLNDKADDIKMLATRSKNAVGATL